MKQRLWVVLAALWLVSPVVMAQADNGNACRYSAKLLERVLGYTSCPQRAGLLRWQLKAIARPDARYTATICQDDAKCLNGSLSLPSDAQGLRNIIGSQKRSDCMMVNEDKAQIGLYVGAYLEKNCKKTFKNNILK